MQTQSQSSARGTPVTERPLVGPLLVFRDHEVRSLLDEEMESPRVGERDAITLRKSDDLSVMRIAIRAGGRLPRHKVAGPFTLFVLSGSVKLVAGDREEVLGPLDMAACDPAVEHEVEALDASHVLVTIAGGHAEPAA